MCGRLGILDKSRSTLNGLSEKAPRRLVFGLM